MASRRKVPLATKNLGGRRQKNARRELGGTLWQLHVTDMGHTDKYRFGQHARALCVIGCNPEGHLLCRRPHHVYDPVTPSVTFLLPSQTNEDTAVYICPNSLMYISDVYTEYIRV